MKLNAQLCFLVDPEPPSRSVATSIDAAEKAREFAELQREIVYAYVKSQGRWGATQKEVADSLGLQRASVCARTWELHGGKRHGDKPEYPVRIHRTGEKREHCAVYIAI